MTQNSDRKKIREKVVDYLDLDFESLDNVIQKFQNIKEDFSKKGYEDFVLEYVYSYYDDSTSKLIITAKRFENDSEYQKRITEEKKLKARQEVNQKKKKDKEYADYLRLKKKFEND